MNGLQQQQGISGFPNNNNMTIIPNNITTTLVPHNQNPPNHLQNQLHTNGGGNQSYGNSTSQTIHHPTHNQTFMGVVAPNYSSNQMLPHPHNASLLPAQLAFLPIQQNASLNSNMQMPALPLSGPLPLPIFQQTSAYNNSRSDVNTPTNQQGLRSGKWLPEEEKYALLLIELFENGLVTDCENGATLRSYLSQKLQCAPMRISKKFAGKGIGKMVYVQKQTADLLSKRKAAEKKLKEAEEKFRKAIFPVIDFMHPYFNFAASNHAGTAHIPRMPGVVPIFNNTTLPSVLQSIQSNLNLNPTQIFPASFPQQPNSTPSGGLPPSIQVNASSSSSITTTQSPFQQGQINNQSVSNVIPGSSQRSYQTSALPASTNNLNYTRNALQMSNLSMSTAMAGPSQVSMQMNSPCTSVATSVSQLNGHPISSATVVSSNGLSHPSALSGIPSTAVSAFPQSQILAKSPVCAQASGVPSQIYSKQEQYSMIATTGSDQKNALLVTTEAATNGSEGGAHYQCPPLLPGLNQAFIDKGAEKSSIPDSSSRDLTHSGATNAEVPDLLSGFDKISNNDQGENDATASHFASESPRFTSPSFDDLHRFLGAMVDSDGKAVVETNQSNPKTTQESTGPGAQDSCKSQLEASNSTSDAKAGKDVSADTSKLDHSPLFSAESYAVFTEPSILEAKSRAHYLASGSDIFSIATRKRGSLDIGGMLKMVSEHTYGHIQEACTLQDYSLSKEGGNRYEFEKTEMKQGTDCDGFMKLALDPSFGPTPLSSHLDNGVLASEGNFDGSLRFVPPQSFEGFKSNMVKSPEWFRDSWNVGVVSGSEPCTSAGETEESAAGSSIGSNSSNNGSDQHSSDGSLSHDDSDDYDSDYNSVAFHPRKKARIGANSKDELSIK